MARHFCAILENPYKFIFSENSIFEKIDSLTKTSKLINEFLDKAQKLEFKNFAPFQRLFRKTFILLFRSCKSARKPFLCKQSGGIFLQKDSSLANPYSNKSPGKVTPNSRAVSAL